jgi:predicted secreted hydrolase
VAESNPSRFAPRQLLFAHAAIADPRYGRLRHDQVAAREGFGLASAAESTVDVAIGTWTLKLVGDAYVAHIEAREFTIDLAFATTQAPMLEGNRGFSRKGRDTVNASYYYSLPHLQTSGTIAVQGDVERVTGTAWFDHEWSSQAMAEDASGWDWTGINFDDGSALMVLRMRDRKAGTLWADATLRSSDGKLRQFAPDEISFTPIRKWRSPRTDVEYPVAMRVNVGGAEYTLEPLLDDQELDSRGSTGTIYWEGAVRVTQADRVVGRGYLELTGYFKALRL